MGSLTSNLTKTYQSGINVAFNSAQYKNGVLKLFFIQDASDNDDISHAPNQLRLPGQKLNQYSLILELDNVGRQPRQWSAGDIQKQIDIGDVKFYSSDDSWFYQGGWEQAAKHGASAQPFPGPNGSGMWDQRHKLSGGLSDGIHLTKHLQQMLDDLPNFYEDIQQNLNGQQKPSLFQRVSNIFKKPSVETTPQQEPEETTNIEVQKEELPVTEEPSEIIAEQPQTDETPDDNIAPPETEVDANPGQEYGVIPGMKDEEEDGVKYWEQRSARVRNLLLNS